ncbi:hypothetical protein [Streptomyces sp. AK02-01A]|uniref:hypothetical protein n=1 Tax=Streptomyces sp. AK02-01A TaxID=3028648 RepID=UPI0029BC60BC|nr:hypothetical protein [Streptomyces sp. AK02-01A]MDX3853699.1 hypothetical protein [Streptomyces sp. AK02-01A]
MESTLRITAFAAVLAASFGAAYGVGDVVGPVADPAPAAHSEHRGASERGGQTQGGGHDASAGGLQISEHGYTLDLRTPVVPAARTTELRFTVRDSAGRQVTAYRREHGEELHLILASKDLATYRHLHPTRAADGTWSTPANLPAAGGYRLFADFTPAAEGAKNLTLGADLAVSGAYQPAPLPAAAATAGVDDYTVSLKGPLRPGEAGTLTLTVTRAGRPVDDLEPYLGAYGHLVALRSGDLAYLHVHPNGGPDDGRTKPGPDVSFTATAPSAGTYRLFLDFKHNGTVRTAAFTVRAGATAQPGESEAGKPSDTEEADGHRH